MSACAVIVLSQLIAERERELEVLRNARDVIGGSETPTPAQHTKHKARASKVARRRAGA